MRVEGEVLAVRQASVALSGRPILQNIEFTLDPGEFCGLIGGNGSGKTTLLRAILGFVPLQGGNITIGGGGARLASVGYVPQKISLDPVRSNAREGTSSRSDWMVTVWAFPSRRRRVRGL